MLLASLRRSDPDHQQCVNLFRSESPPFFIPAMVLAELCYMVQRDLGNQAEVDLLERVSRPEFHIIEVRPDLARIAALAKQYTPMGGTDASIVAAAERLRMPSIATLDHRHFTKVRPRHVPGFTLLP